MRTDMFGEREHQQTTKRSSLTGTVLYTRWLCSSSYIIESREIYLNCHLYDNGDTSVKDAWSCGEMSMYERLRHKKERRNKTLNDYSRMPSKRVAMVSRKVFSPVETPLLLGMALCLARLRKHTYTSAPWVFNQEDIHRRWNAGKGRGSYTSAR